MANTGLTRIPKFLLGYHHARRTYLHFNSRYATTPQVHMNTIEHIVPQHLYKQSKSSIRCDMHNFLVFHQRLNSSKNCFKYIPPEVIMAHPDRAVCLDHTGSKQPCVWSDAREPDHYILSYKLRHVVPPRSQRGVIARSIAYMSQVYPQYADRIFHEVIDPATLADWHRCHPVSGFEYDRNLFISFIQGNHNPFVLYPESLEEELYTRLIPSASSVSASSSASSASGSASSASSSCAVSSKASDCPRSS